MPLWLLWVAGSAAVAAAGTGGYVLSNKVGDAVIIGGAIYLIVVLGKK